MQRRWSKPKTLHDTRPVALNERIGSTTERHNDRSPLVTLHIYCNRAFATIEWISHETKVFGYVRTGSSSFYANYVGTQVG
jgi:hypothetical protein